MYAFCEVLKYLDLCLNGLCCCQTLPAGILASVDGCSLVSDSSWKCSANNVTGWSSKSFDDSSWSSGVITETNTASGRRGCLSQIPQNAKWIWTSKNQGSTCDKSVYFRGYCGRYWVQGYIFSMTLTLWARCTMHDELQHNVRAFVEWDNWTRAAPSPSFCIRLNWLTHQVNSLVLTAWAVLFWTYRQPLASVVQSTDIDLMY